MVDLNEPLTRFVGKGTADAFATKLGLHTAGDLLRHYPRRYQNRGELSDLSSLRVGEDVTVLAKVESFTSRKMKYRRGYVYEVVVTDGSGRLLLTFFKPVWPEGAMRAGRRGLFAGKVGVFKKHRQLVHPTLQLLDDDIDALDAAAGFAGELIPIYPAATKLESWRIQKAVQTLLPIAARMPDPLPELLRRRRRLPPLSEALVAVHKPRDRDQVRRARERLAWDEAFGLQLALARRRADVRALPAAPRPYRSGGLVDAFDARLPFTLTRGQQAVAAELGADLARDHPMQRLLQGEVGSGKTVVAVRAMLTVVDSGGQAALLAPTEVLAQQHHRSITELLGPLAQRGQLGGADQATRVTLLSGSQGSAARRRALLEVVSGDAGIVVGTHALLEEGVEFHDLGLVVVDEQHRFGVEQRDALRAKARRPPHLLVMTATPIPRTVAMTVFGDLDVSTLTELPQGRSAIATHVVAATERPRHLDRAWERAREEVARGHQVYVVCPRIGGDEDAAVADRAADQSGEPPSGDTLFDELDAAPRRPPLAVLEVAPMLAEGPLHSLRLGALHGRMPADEKEEVMRRFTGGALDVLVSTTVIEVGIDVPNATVMIVMDADRFGVSQLHQLRGRVGRGSAPGLCLLVTDAPGGTAARQRVDAVAATLDGFELSRIDLEQRREGDVLGASQSGRRSSLRLLNVLRDEELIRAARDEATLLVDADPQLAGHPALAAAVEDLLSDERTDYLEKA